MGELITKYWWVLAVGLALILLVVSRSRGSSGTFQTIGGDDATALASLAAQENIAEGQRRAGLIDRLLNYDLTRTGLAISERQADLDRDIRLDLARIGSETQIAVSENAGAQAIALANAQYAAQLQQSQLAAQLQQAALRNANSASSRAAWQNILAGGLGTLTPILYDIFDIDFPGSGGGGWGGWPGGTAPTFPGGFGSSGGGWGGIFGF